MCVISSENLKGALSLLLNLPPLKGTTNTTRNLPQFSSYCTKKKKIARHERLAAQSRFLLHVNIDISKDHEKSSRGIFTAACPIIFYGFTSFHDAKLFEGKSRSNSSYLARKQERRKESCYTSSHLSCLSAAVTCSPWRRFFVDNRIIPTSFFDGK